MPSEENKRIAKNTLFLYFRMLFTMAVSLYTSRIVLATLGIDDFGVYTVVGGVVAMLGFLNSSLSGGTQRFLTFELGKNDFVKLKNTFSAALNIHILLAIVIFILAETIGLWFLIHEINVPLGRENAAMWVYQFSILTMCISIIQVPFNASIIAHERMNVYAYVSILEVLLKLLVVYLLLISNYDKLALYAVLIFMIILITTCILWLYCKSQYLECRFGYVRDKSLYRSMLIFSGWDILGNGAVIGATQGANIILNIFFGTMVNAARGVAVQVSTAIAAFVNNFQTAVNPQIVKLYAVGKINELYNLLFQNAKFSFSLMWLLLLPVFLELETILKIWLVEVPEYTALFCRLILLQSLISCVQRPFVKAIHATGRMKVFNLTAGIVLLSVLPISYFFLKAGGLPYVPFIVHVSATLLEFICELYLLKRWINLPINALIKNVFIPQLLIIACTLPVSLLFSFYFPFLLTIIFSVLSVCISVYFIALNKETRIKVINKIKSIILKKIAK